MFCFPYAGGSATAFWKWRDELPDSLQVEFVELPGRDRRALDHDRISPRAIARAIGGSLKTPYAFYGHSMGARLAFEVTRELAKLGAAPPVRLFVGAAHPPHLPEPIARITHLSEDEFIDQLILRAGAPAELRTEPDVRAAVMPAVRTDLNWLKRYRYRYDTPLDVPIVAFAGARDREVSPEVMLGWARHTSASFRLHTVDGAHLFIGTGGDPVPAAIGRELTAAMAGHRNGHTQPVELPAREEIHVWRATLDRMPQTCAATAELSPRERARVDAFRHDVDRRRHIGRCVVLRRLLRRYGADVGTEELPVGRYGKPAVHHPANLRFSLSHSAGTVVVALSTGHEVGVDVERVRPMADLEAFCEGALTPAERVEVADESEESQLVAALRFWTAKESLLKATGDGLRIEPTSFSFAGQPRGAAWCASPEPELVHLAEWRVSHLDLEGAVAAVAAPHASWRLRYETLQDGTR